MAGGIGPLGTGTGTPGTGTAGGIGTVGTGMAGGIGTVGTGGCCAEDAAHIAAITARARHIVDERQLRR
jgi:hypothetical protein